MAEKLIEIGKIVRNTTKSNLNNGDMEEIINLRREEGKWKPLTENVRIWNGIEEEHEFYSQLFVHTGKNYKHILGVLKDGFGIDYVANIIDDDNVEIIPNGDRATGVFAKQDFVQVHQVGNLLCINDKHYVKYLLWKEDKYVKKSTDLNELNEEGYLAPDGLSQLRVVPTCNEEGVPTMLVVNGDITDNDKTDWDSIKETASANGLSLIAQARKVAKERGLLNGFCVGVVAFRLTDNSYTYASRPILLSQPCDEGTRYEEEYGFEDIANVSKDINSRVSKYIDKDSIDQNDFSPITSNGKKHSYRYNPKAMNVVWQKNEVFPADEYKADKRGYFWNDNIKDALNKSGISESTKENCKSNCEVYWGGGSQGHNVGDVYKEGAIQYGSEENGVSTYGDMPLYEKDGSKSSASTDVPLGFSLFSMPMRRDSSDYDKCFRQVDSTVSIRGSFAQEITIPYEDRMTTNKRAFEFHRGADCFNPPNAFSVIHSQPTNGNDTCRNWFSARKQSGTMQAYGFAMTNGLQVKIGNYDADYSDIISEVCVFLSSEIYSADENKGTAVKSYLTDVCEVNKDSSTGTAVRETGATVYANPKENKDLAQEIKDIPVLYKVWSKPYKNVKTGEWIDIDLSVNLNILEECETLNVDAINCRNAMRAKCSYLYNGRLHLGNIEEDYFDGFPLSYFEMAEQWKKSVTTNFSRSLATAYDFRDTAGKDSNMQAFKLIGTDIANANIYAAKKATINEVVENGVTYETISISSSIYTYKSSDNSTCGYIRYIDSNNGNYYTITKEGERLDISIDTYKKKVGDVWEDDVAYVINEPNTNELLAFVKVSSNEVSFDYDTEKILEQIDRYFTHHADKNKGFWEGNWQFLTTELAFMAGMYLGDIIGNLSILYSNKALIDGVKALINRNVDKNNLSTLENRQLAADRYFLSRLFFTMWWKYDVCKQWNDELSNLVEREVPIYIITELDTADGRRRVGRIEKRKDVKPLNPMLSYPDSRADKMIIGWIDEANNKVHEVEYKLEPFSALSCGVYVDEDVKPIEWWNKTTDKDLSDVDYLVNENGEWDIVRVSVVEDRRNVLKVSATESPLFFPAENTYQVGNGEIVGMCSNTVALSTGQWGDAPLYVFCSDGIYGLFVDTSGQLVYPSARPISREVCNNALGITPIDDAVVYPSERGLFMISGSTNQEISKQVEGRPLQFAEEYGYERLDSMPVILNKRGNNGEARNDSWLNECMQTAPTDEDFKEYIKNAKCGWGYNHSEVWVSNPDKDYTYIFSEGGWSKVMRKIEYFINDYPRTYFVSKSENEGGDETTYEVYDMGKNNDAVITDCFFLTRPIVIDGEIAKTFTEAWLYGNFSVALNRPLTDEDRKFVHKASIIVYGSQDGTKYSMIGIGGVRGETRNIVAKLHRMSMRYIRIAFAGRLRAHSEFECLGVEAKMSWGEKSSKKVR